MNETDEIQELRQRVRELETALQNEEAFHHQIRAAIEPRGGRSLTDQELVELSMERRGFK